MINLRKAKQVFLRYANKFDKTNWKNNFKKYHSLRVMKISKKIAKNFFEDKEKIELAQLIGLLHDIGRFEQVNKYNTFSDILSIDHGNLGEQILKENQFIRKFIETDKYDNIILKSIKNHNKYEIEEGLTKEEEIFCKIVRDADKVDIMYEGYAKLSNKKEDVQEIEKCLISQDIWEQINAGKTVKVIKEMKNNKLEKMIILLAMMYDINYKKSFELVDKKKYLNKIIDKYNYQQEDTKNKMEQLKKSLKNQKLYKEETI